MGKPVEVIKLTASVQYYLYITLLYKVSIKELMFFAAAC
jgi:hypothetical protein